MENRKFRLWLLYVDKQLSAEAVAFVKLGLHSEFRRCYTEVEVLTEPSLLYNVLLKQHRETSESEVLRMFLHVLDGLSGKLRGKWVIRKGFGDNSAYKLENPGHFDAEKASKEFKFFQCLLKILIKVRQDVDLSDHLTTRFSRDRFLGTNPRHIRYLPELFIKLCQRGFLAPDDTHHLEQALTRHEAWECLQDLNEYHKSVGLMAIPKAEKLKRTIGSIYSSSDPTSAVDTTVSDALEPCQYKRHFRQTILEPEPDSDDDYHRDIEVLLDDTGHVQSSTEAGKTEEEDSGVIESSETTRMLTHTPEVDWSKTEKMITSTEAMTGEVVFDGTRPNRVKRSYKFLWLMIICLLVLVLVVAILTLLIEMWLPLKPPASDNLSILRGSPIIVKEIDSWFYKTVVVGLDDNSTAINNSDTYVNFYGVYDYCDGQHVLFPIKQDVIFTDKNISNYVPDYFALKGTFFEYEILGNSPHSAVQVCADNGNSPGQCSTNLPWGEGSVFYKVTTPGYYFFRLKSSDDITDYKLIVHQNFKILATSQMDFLGCSINTKNQACEFSLPLRKKYCLMAKLYEPNVTSQVELNVQIKESRLEIMLAIPLSLLVLLVMLFLLFLVCLPFCYLRFCITRQARPI